jgi:hypothetical protein
MLTRAQNLADAILAIACANHYMVGLSETVTTDELDAAEQILITKQNSTDPTDIAWLHLDLALDLIDTYRKKDHA